MNATRVLRPGEDEWPHGITEALMDDKPERLFAIGRPLPAYEKAIGVVGTRRPTAAGIEAARRLARGLAEGGFTIVSGLALGIDAVAHDAALRAGGTTVAVLGSGLEQEYPRRNLNLKSRIRERGTLVSEYPAGTPPLAHHFPERNRIIAAVSYGVLVIEGGPNSGALITARRALEANRLVWALPGSWRNAMAEGPNELIRVGEAALVTEASHIFEEIAPALAWTDGSGAAPGGVPELSEDETRILAYLDDTPLSLDRIAMDLNLTAGATAVALSRIEIRGLVAKRRGGYEVTRAGARTRAALMPLDVE